MDLRNEITFKGTAIVSRPKIWEFYWAIVKRHFEVFILYYLSESR